MPALSSERPAKVAIPATATTDTVPLSVAPPGFVPMASVTVPVYDVTGLFAASCACTTTLGAMGTPATALDGWTMIASFVATPEFAVAVKSSGDPASVPEVAVTAFAPAVAPSVSVVRARPAASVMVAVALSDPPPTVTAQPTATPLTGLPSASVTRATNACGSAVLTVADCAPPLSATIALAVPALIVNAVDVTPVSPLAEATSVYPAPERLIDIPAKVATPATAATVAVPLSTPPLGLAPMASVMLPVYVGAGRPDTSRAATAIDGAIAAPALVMEGCAVKVSCVATPGPVPVAVASATIVWPAQVIESWFTPAAAPSVHAKLAIPVAFVVAGEPLTVPPPPRIDAVTVAAATALPSASLTCTSNGSGRAAPALALWLSPPTTLHAAAGPRATSNAALVAPASPLAVATSV